MGDRPRMLSHMHAGQLVAVRDGLFFVGTDLLRASPPGEYAPMLQHTPDKSLVAEPLALLAAQNAILALFLAIVSFRRPPELCDSREPAAAAVMLVHPTFPTRAYQRSVKGEFVVVSVDGG